MRTNVRNKLKLDFPLEEHLLRVLKRTACKLIAPASCNVAFNVAKFPVGMIIPDLIVIAGPEKLEICSKSRIPSMFECAVVANLLVNGPRTLDQLARELYARTSMLEKAALRLKKYGFLKERKGVLHVNKLFFPSSIKVVSVEAKLRRWRDALAQAEEYLKFSNFAYVALPKAVVVGNKKIKVACRIKGIGLIAVNGIAAEIVVRAKKSKPVTTEWVWLIRKTASLARIKRVALNR